MKKIAQNIPNMLSGYRLLMFPMLLFFIFSGERKIFILFFCINLITDILDGLIARTFKLETEFGAKLDSAADIGSMIAAFMGMLTFEKNYMTEKFFFFIFLFAMWILPQLICIFRFRRFPHFHLYSNKIAGYFMGVFFFTFFVIGKAEWYFYVMFTSATIAFLEELIVVVKIPQLRSNVKGIYWMLKEKGRIA